MLFSRTKCLDFWVAMLYRPLKRWPGGNVKKSFFSFQG
jgi:hypothetical protein